MKLLVVFLIKLVLSCQNLSDIVYNPYYDNGKMGYSTILAPQSYIIIDTIKPNFISYSGWIKSLCETYNVSSVIIQSRGDMGFLEYSTTESVNCAVYQSRNTGIINITDCLIITNATNPWIEYFNQYDIGSAIMLLSVYSVIVLILHSAFIIAIYVSTSPDIGVCSRDKDSLIIVFMLWFIRVINVIYLITDPFGIKHIIPHNISRFLSVLQFPWIIVINIIIANKYVKIIFSFPKRDDLYKKLNIINIVLSSITVGLFLISAITKLLWFNLGTWFSIILLIFGGIFYILTTIYFLITGIWFLSSALGKTSKAKKLKRRILYKILIITIFQVAVFVTYSIETFNISSLVTGTMVVYVIYGLINLTQLSIFSGMIKLRKDKN